MESVERYLNTRGFAAMRPISLTETPCFTGRIFIGSWQLQLELRFPENKYDYPQAYLPEWPHDPTIRSAFGFRHINDEGIVCYADESRTWWDSAMATELVAGALERIEKLLLNNLEGAPAREVIARDFGGYWSGESSLFVANYAQNRQLFSQVSEKNSERQWLVPEIKPSWIEIDIEKSPNTPWLVLHLDNPPSLLNTDYWPPKTLAQVFSWIKFNSPSAVNQLVATLRYSIFPKGKAKQTNYKQKVGVMLLWSDQDGSSTLGCGFCFTVPELSAQAIGQNRFKQAANMLMRDCNKIVRYNLNRADPHYIQTRNTPNTAPSLKNRRVILVGVGTIGGHLAKLLCAHSAGWGKRGELHIIDPDRFSVENIGRHLLGAESLGSSKANAVASHLKSSFPYLNIKAYDSSVTKCWHLLTDDCIIIDATGSQTVSIAIPDYLSQKKLNPVVLHSWVHGHGAATVALLNDRKVRKSACFRCLWRLENNTYYPRYKLSQDHVEDAPVFASCHHSYHAYASTVSMIAATQAMTLLYDHLAKRAKKTLRFNVLRTDLCQNRPDTTPTQANECPICHR